MSSPCYFGIYGFEITQAIKVGPLSIGPLFDNAKKANETATNRDVFNFTAVGEYHGDSVYSDLFDLSAILTFCQQQWVQITTPLTAASAEEVMGKLPQKLDLPYRRPTQGALIISDTIDPGARRAFIELCFHKLQDKEFEKITNFRSAFFRNVESWRLQKPFVDLTYYLDFSGLEILARTGENDFTTKNVAAVLAKFLPKIGFAVTEDNLKERHLAMKTYAQLRNALFHNGNFEVTFDENGKDVTLALKDYENYLRRLVPDALLKVVGYDDAHINWNRWVNRTPFR
jgi:hypothetical protein